MAQKKVNATVNPTVTSSTSTSVGGVANSTTRASVSPTAGATANSINKVTASTTATQTAETTVSTIANPNTDTTIYDCIIVGSGPAGYTASIYLGRGDIKHLLIASTLSPGGSLMNSSIIENFPGFPDGVSGPKLMGEMQKQAEKFGDEIVFEDVQKIELIPGSSNYLVQTVDKTFQSRTVILAMGGNYRKLNVPGESQYLSKGVSYCATCDGFFFKDKIVAVVGGGDTALEEALFLANFVQKVYLIHRREELRASEIMQDRVKAEPKIHLVLNALVQSIDGDDTTLTHLQLTPKLGSQIIGADSQLQVDGVFIAIGHDPNNSIAQNLVELDENGYIKVFQNQATSAPGIYAAGDITDPIYRQAITAAASGCRAAKDVIAHLHHSL